jgi:redox-sensitive bicupin YhaK (pirin superfamily)
MALWWVAADRRLYVHLVRGSLRINGTPLQGGDALKLTEVRELALTEGADAEVLVFDLPGEPLYSRPTRPA